VRPIVLVAFEALGFDPRMMRGGTAGLVWNLACEYVRAGREVVVVTPAHGCVAHLARRHELGPVAWHNEESLPVALDPALWKGFSPELDVPLHTGAAGLRHDGVQVYLLGNELLDRFPESFYPANELIGHDLAALKPLAFQAAALQFLEEFAAPGPVIVQAVEPLYTYLVCAAYAGRADRLVLATVAMNPSATGTVYRPQLQRVLSEFDVALDLDEYADPPDDALRRRMRRYLRPSHERGEQRVGDISYHALVAGTADLLDYVSPGQRDYAATYDGSPTARLFVGSRTASVLRRRVDRQIVGGAGLPDFWLAADPGAIDRATVLGGLGLDPTLPTFFHAARFDPNHKGQLELMRAVEAVLADGVAANFVVHCAVGAAGATEQVGSPELQRIADRFPRNVHLSWRMVAEPDLYPTAATADFCVFPSKFELDGFLITMGEAMALGAVPIATAQQTLAHFRHALPLSHPDATGLSVPRSFRADDDLLVAALVDVLRTAVRLYTEDPAWYAALSSNARRLARTFTWRRAAAVRLAAVDALLAGRPVGEDPVRRAIGYGWFDELADDDLAAHRDLVAEAALHRGDADAWRRCHPDEPLPAAALFDAAYRRGDLDRCRRLLDDVDAQRQDTVRGRMRVDPALRTVRYRHDHALRVELVLSVQHGTDAGRGRRYLHPMRSTGAGWFVGSLPPEATTDDLLVLLLTLPSGRIAWDCWPTASGA
jgi:hypothetical protein